MLFFHKDQTRLGGLPGARREVVKPPVQFIAPSGAVSIGTPPGQQPERERPRYGSDGNGYLMSWDEPRPAQLEERQHFVQVFCVGFVVSTVFSALLLFNVVSDISKVEDAPVDRWFDETGGVPRAFEPLPSHIAPFVVKQWVTGLLVSLVGLAGMLQQSSTLLFVFVLATVANFFMAAMAPPSFLSTIRFVCDLTMVYIAQKLRARIELSWVLPPPEVSRQPGWLWQEAF